MIKRERKYNADGSRLDRNPYTRTIIGVDGEGWNIPLSDGITSANPFVADKGWHSYVMLAAADDTGRRMVKTHDGSRQEATDTEARNYGLPTVTCCKFLLDLNRSGENLIVGFSFNYDAAKIFADLPLENIRELCNEAFIPQEEYERRVINLSADYGLSVDYVHKARLVSTATTVYEGYWIHYTPRKQLKIIDLEAGRDLFTDHFMDKNGTWRYGKPSWDWKRQVIVWDVFGFYQKAFVAALEDYRCGQCPACQAKPQEHCLKSPWSPADLEHIREMKLHRGVFDPSQEQEIADYCVDECRYLSFLVRDLITNIESFGLKLDRFDGTGAVASAWMKQKGIKKSLPIRLATDTQADEVPEFYLSGLPESVALCAYFGGRFEISEINYMPVLYGYDINSAYPSVTVSLPCLAHGRFTRVSEYVPGRIGVYLAGSRTSGTFAPFPFRTEREPGESLARDAIYFAHGGKRWIWQDELAIACKHFGTDAIPVFDGWIWEGTDCDCNPFADIPGMYKERQQYVIDGNGIEKVIKLILNSLYGKTAQSIGWKIAEDGEKLPPPFQCFIWAGLITSGCRAMILDAIMQPGADVVSIATDGILSRTPIALNIDHVCADGCKVEPGTKCPHGNKPVKVLGGWDYAKVTDAYLFQSGVYTYVDGKGKRVYKTRGFSRREITAEQLIAAFMAGDLKAEANPTESRFVPMKSGVSRTDALEYIGQWIPSVHDVSFVHNRRLPRIDFDNPNILGQLHRFSTYSDAPIVPDDMMSAPYEPKQTWEDVMENQAIGDEYDFFEVEDWPNETEPPCE